MNHSPTLADHMCPGGCHTVVTNTFACRDCWRRLPMEHQTPILTSQWANDEGARSRAFTDAMHWFTEHPARGFKIPGGIL